MANIEQKFREACSESGLASMLNQLNNQALNGLVSATMNLLKEKAAGNTIEGVIKTIGVTENVSKTGNPFNKRKLVLDISRFNSETGEKYENYVEMHFTQKRCDDLDGFAVGERVCVTFGIGGREWNGKIINDIAGFKIERIGGAQAAAPRAPQAPQAAPPTPAAAPQAASQQAPQGNTQGAQADLPF